jgi:hypothetical protein
LACLIDNALLLTAGAGLGEVRLTIKRVLHKPPRLAPGSVQPCRVPAWDGLSAPAA